MIRNSTKYIWNFKKGFSWHLRKYRKKNDECLRRKWQSFLKNMFSMIIETNKTNIMNYKVYDISHIHIDTKLTFLREWCESFIIPEVSWAARSVKRVLTVVMILRTTLYHERKLRVSESWTALLSCFFLGAAGSTAQNAMWTTFLWWVFITIYGDRDLLHIHVDTSVRTIA